MKLLRIDDTETRSLCWSTFGRIICEQASDQDDYGDDDFEDDDSEMSVDDEEPLSKVERAQNVVMKRLVEEGAWVYQLQL